VASLDDAFASEVAVRLPRLLAAARRLGDGAVGEVPGGSTAAAHVIMSDAHALASSAAVVGEDIAAYAARECEQLLAAFVRNVGPARTDDAATEISGAVDALHLALSRWTDNRSMAAFVPQQPGGRR
jgi:HPt (histidine-containing phosphotransfer) domain-containing protein